nr:hypothetical protein CFP56_07473 [Quercus suber]
MTEHALVLGQRPKIVYIIARVFDLLSPNIDVRFFVDPKSLENSVLHFEWESLGQPLMLVIDSERHRSRAGTEMREDNDHTGRLDHWILDRRLKEQPTFGRGQIGQRNESCGSGVKEHGFNRFISCVRMFTKSSSL